MNKDKATATEHDEDRQVADYYASLADETAPASLDRAVMRDASRALRADNRKGSYGAWFRPAAFVATAGLCLLIVIDIARLGVFDAQDSGTAAVDRPAENRAAEAARPRPSQTSLNEIKRQEKAAAAAPQAAIASPETSASIADNGRPGEGQVSKLQVAPAQTAEQLPAADARACSGEQTATATQWWACIRSLRDAGRHGDADLEFDLLSDAFPDFMPPE